ncbi:cyclase family protein [Mesosutterella sp. OilRF-GAM-744-9]|uniref:Cyclase family protein n=1 Tax=Mesosutterella porci TaxID=2915351 RepID=A0ABS9MT29_9BURK|nr:cyclase family protein [Mesosutterella sp. oilRF-744-WT-GAM-9]MCG5031489.1 cyclase family protein [Mesosutterella sp. oilRF-744-WT-GAM-9]
MAFFRFLLQEAADNAMTVLDFTRTISPGMPLFPGTPRLRLKEIAGIGGEGYRETQLLLTSHTGTHIDAPAHIFPSGKTLEDYPASQFTGSLAVLDCTGFPPGSEIPASFLEEDPLAPQAEFLFFRTGWEKFWGERRYFEAYPVLSAGAARWAAEKGKKALGFDTPGIDPAEDAALSLHRIMLGSGRTLVIENLCGLSAAPAGFLSCAALPLKFEGSDGAPARVIGWTP